MVSVAHNMQILLAKVIPLDSAAIPRLGNAVMQCKFSEVTSS
jgi:hypothetical protein